LVIEVGYCDGPLNLKPSSASQRHALSHLRASKAVVEHSVEKLQQISKIQPEAAIQATSVESAVQQSIVPLDHHETLAFQAVHVLFPMVVRVVDLAESIKDQR
jgi:hypothetical protein